MLKQKKESINKISFFTLEVSGNSGGRVYLKMVQDVLAPVSKLKFIKDYKRHYRWFRGRKIIHLFKIFFDIIRIHDTESFYLWDDISIIFFSKQKLKKTLFIFHHLDQKHFDSAPFENLIWHLVLKQLKYCNKVICVSPYWKKFLSEKKIRAEIIYNSFDVERIQRHASRHNKTILKLPEDRINVYLGQGALFKGVDEIFNKFKEDKRINLFITAKNDTGLPVKCYNGLEYDDYLNLVSQADVAIFASSLLEGWNRCATETILLGIPCILKPIAGLGDLQHITNMPIYTNDLTFEDLVSITQNKYKFTKSSSNTLSAFNLKYFSESWLRVVINLCAYE
ncbi:MAG: hypothetical protein UX09_C0004G0024 [Candidatus Uhrbacteria bacterium GW2011_GWE2_45_35]|uniref:Glycosyltransferase subfamily 4-like N-terminal domain-containing protein n=2 Tax=Candidatus Uhriibacteriota TaxID=1752732 RepID=A0A0G1JKD8_9BACT|nr:MAG: hypothetical protein UW63_C0002G0004 [Candidatus Uhrbacteria bacterium GW2011_GWF2_44_350]KKU09104.1 MAG: hypothetical protein UX09_C0004G0024 [Candidatus Uhrbacteria bacterium GW2011_GWE2_45_35]HBR80355.1 hypothetical protein [Candidatus Uhrbacteria bacterium]HCU31278.1 hypothetical protein [Candidatus Uhrbacteria bacterium]